MFENLLISQNPHWVEDTQACGAQREKFSQLLAYLPLNQVISVLGIRRSGKSTLLRQLIAYLIHQENINPKNILFLNLEHPYFSAYAKEIKYLETAFEDYLRLCLPAGKIYILLDELQFFPDWPVFVKAHYEQGNCKFVVTGSNSSLLSSDILTMLSGRTLPIEIYPLSLREIAHSHAIDINNPEKIYHHRHLLAQSLELLIEFGGFPEVALGEHHDTQNDILAAYAKTILYQDVAPRLNTRKSQELESLFVYLISNIGKLFSFHQLSKLFDLSDKAVKDYIDAFEDAYLLFQLDCFSFSIKKQIRNPKKIYAIDTGLAQAVAFRFSKDHGYNLENVIFIELKRMALMVFYYKTDKSYEIDFLVKKGMSTGLIQICWNLENSETKQREIRALINAASELKLTRGVIITAMETEELHIENLTIKVVPAYYFLCLKDEEKMVLMFG